MKSERPNYQVIDTQHATRVISPKEKKMIRDSNSRYSGSLPRAIDSGEFLPHPPKKK